MSFNVVVRNSSGEVVATQQVYSIDAAKSWADSTIAGMQAQGTTKAKTLIKKDFDGALYSGMSLRVTAGIDAALDRVTTALKGGGALPRIDSTSSGKGWIYSESPIGLWNNKPAMIEQVEYKTTGSEVATQNGSVGGDVYSEGIAGTKAFDSLGALEWDGKPVSEILYAPIVEPEDPDTMGFIAG